MGIDINVYVFAGIQIRPEVFDMLCQAINVVETIESEYNNIIYTIDAKPNIVPIVVYLTRIIDLSNNEKKFYLVAKFLGQMRTMRDASPHLRLETITDDEKKEFFDFCGLYGIETEWYGQFVFSAIE